MARHRDDEDLVGNGGDGRELSRNDNKSRSGKTAEDAARSELRAFVERIERLEEEKATVNDDIKEVYGEAKAMGYDTKVLRKIIAIRKKDAQERSEEEMVMDTYLMALGMAPLGGGHDDV